MPVITLPDGELRDEIRQPAYDTVVLAAGAVIAGIRRFFITNMTATGPKSLAQTNMERAGSFPTATSYLLQGLTIDADNQAPANSAFLPIFLRKSSVALQIGTKNYWESPLRFACGRMQTDLAAGGVAATYQQYGWAAIQPVVFQGRHVVEINPLQNFLINWSVSADDLTAAEVALTVAAGTDLVFVASLKGLLRRPVQ